MPVASNCRYVRMAVGLVNTSVPRPVDADVLRAALLDPAAPGQYAARILLEEAPAQMLAGLVLEGFVHWHNLNAAADRYPPAKHETAAWLRDMARLALA